jgi:hypothetical protein
VGELAFVGRNRTVTVERIGGWAPECDRGAIVLARPPCYKSGTGIHFAFAMPTTYSRTYEALLDTGSRVTDAPQPTIRCLIY